jgi:hypothetical protein
LPTSCPNFQRVTITWWKPCESTLAGQPVSYQCVSDDRIAVSQDRSAIDKVRILFSAHMKLQFSASIAPCVQRFDAASGQVAIAAMLNPQLV